MYRLQRGVAREETSKTGPVAGSAFVSDADADARGSSTGSAIRANSTT